MPICGVKAAPRGPQWVYEIKHDGYRLIVRRHGGRVKLYTRRGYDWSDRFPWITEAVGKLRIQSAVFDGEPSSAPRMA
jgi:bifunctional non-homologous end joining protein LigD